LSALISIQVLPNTNYQGEIICFPLVGDMPEHRKCIVNPINLGGVGSRLPKLAEFGDRLHGKNLVAHIGKPFCSGASASSDINDPG